MQISAPVQPGASGGPVFDRNGLVVGVVVAKLDAARVADLTGDIPQNINFAVRAEIAKLFLAAQGVAYAQSDRSTGLRRSFDAGRRGPQVHRARHLPLG